MWLTQSPFIRLCPNYVTFRKQNNFLVIAHKICGILILVILLYDLGEVVLLLFDGKKINLPHGWILVPCQVKKKKKKKSESKVSLLNPYLGAKWGDLFSTTLSTQQLSPTEASWRFWVFISLKCEAKEGKGSCLCAREEKLTDVMTGRSSSLSLQGGCHSDSGGVMQVGLISLFLQSRSGISALGWLFTIPLEDPLVQWTQSSSHWRQISIPQCVILPTYLVTG